MKKTPLGLVKERFESKAKLIDAVKKLAEGDLWLDRVNDIKGLAKVSNAKLLRLLAALERAKKEFGSRDKLIKAISDAEKRSQDAGFVARLAAYPLPRLLDLLDSGDRRRKAAAKKAKSKKAPVAPKKKPSQSKKARAKRAAKAPAPTHKKK